MPTYEELCASFQAEIDAMYDPRPERLRVMHNMYGRDPEHKCGQCKHLIARHYSKVYYKCGLTRLTCGPATDWRTGWEACGKFEEGEGEDE